MRARIFDKIENKYYISEVYGILNCGVNLFLVDKLNESDKVVLVEYLDLSSKPQYEVNVEKIDINPVKKGKWIYKNKKEMKIINDSLKDSKEYNCFKGYESIWNHKDALTDLIKNGSAEKSGLGIGDISTKLDGWNYIETQEDIDFLIKEFSGFHDSVIKEFSYITGDYYNQKKKFLTLSESGSKKLRIVFDSTWAKEIEIIFLAPRFVQLVPPWENYMSDLYDVSIFIKDCMVYFYDSYLEEIPEEYDETFIYSMGMMWRFTE